MNVSALNNKMSKESAIYFNRKIAQAHIFQAKHFRKMKNSLILHYKMVDILLKIKIKSIQRFFWLGNVSGACL